MSQNEIRLGVVGCGGFGLFALQHFTQISGVKLVGMAGTHRPAEQAAAQRFEIAEIESVDALVARSDVDMVYIATPPFLHYEQAMSALWAGKHVLCEKPLARTLREADEMIELARQQELLLAANLMQRYNPLFEAVERRSGSLYGELCERRARQLLSRVSPAGRLDRQEMRIVFERGDITLYEWVPTRVRLHAIANEAQARTLCEIFPGARLDVAEIYSADQRACRGRHKSLDAYQKLELHYGDDERKMIRYGQLLRSLFADQLAWIRDRSHRRRVCEKNGRDSLPMAEQADQLAR